MECHMLCRVFSRHRERGNMTTIAIIGSGHVGSNLAKAAIAHGYDVVLALATSPRAPRSA